MPALPWRSPEWRYVAKAYGYLPLTFLRRVVFGRDPYWRRFFWSRWGFVPRDALAALAGGPVIWIEAISGGEVTQIVSFCRALRAALPGHRLLLATNNRYSYEFARGTLAVDAVVDSPWDCRGPVKRALAVVAPRAIVGVENLTSPRLFHVARRRGVTTLLVSGLMSKDFHRHPMMRRSIPWQPFRGLDGIGAKSEEDARGFVAVGARADRVSVTGNMKFDVDYLWVAPHERPAIFGQVGLDPRRRVLLAASIHPGEERFVGEAFVAARREVSDLDLVLVPRYQFHIPAMEQTLAGLGLSCLRKSALDGSTASPGQVVIVDTFGELARLFAVATLVFLGGTTYLRNVVGMGQNMAEPLVHEVPVFFGPHLNLWRDVCDELKKVWPGVEVTTPAELGEGLMTLCKDAELLARLRERTADIVRRHGDDVRRNVELVVRAAR